MKNQKGPTLLDILMPPVRSNIPPHLVQFRFVYYAGDGIYKGTNDDVLGWNWKRPDWVGFMSKNGTRWYVHKSDLTPASLNLVVQEIAKREERKAEELKKTRIVGDYAKRRAQSKLDGMEEMIIEAMATHKNIYAMSKAMNVNGHTLKRKLKNMGEL